MIRKYLLSVVAAIFAIIGTVGCSLNPLEEFEFNPDNTADWLYSDDVEDKEFYLICLGDYFQEISDLKRDVYFSGMSSIDIEDGQIAYLKADVEILSGGEAGHYNDTQVNKIEDYYLVSYDDAIEILDIKSIEEADFDDDNVILYFKTESDTYILYKSWKTILVYANDTLFLEYEYKDLEDKFSPFYDALPEVEPIAEEGEINGITYKINYESGYYCQSEERGYFVDTLNQPDAPYFYFIYSGPKSTGGYSIEVVDITIDEDGKAVITVKENDPAPDATVTEAITYPMVEVSFFPYPSEVKIFDVDGYEYMQLNVF